MPYWRAPQSDHIRKALRNFGGGDIQMWCGRPGRLGPGRSVGAFLEGVLAELHGRTVMQGRVRSKAGPGLQPVKSSVPSSAAGDRRHNASARLADLTAQGEAPPISFLLRWCAGAQHRQKQQHRPQQQRAGEGLVCAISASAMVFIPHQSHSHRDWRAGPPPGPSLGNRLLGIPLGSSPMRPLGWAPAAGGKQAMVCTIPYRLY